MAGLRQETLDRVGQKLALAESMKVLRPEQAARMFLEASEEAAIIQGWAEEVDFMMEVRERSQRATHP